MVVVQAVLLWMSSCLVVGAVRQGVGEGVGEGAGWGAGVDMGVLLRAVADHHLRGCYIVLVTNKEYAAVFRALGEGYHAILVLDAEDYYSYNASPPALLHHLEGLKGADAKFPCHVFFLHLTTQASLDPQLRLLEDIQLPLRPGTKVVGVGPLSLAHSLIFNTALLNTAHALYIAIPPPSTPPTPPTSLLRLKGTAVNSSDQFRSFHGHKFRIVSMDWFPFLSFTRDSNAAGTTVTPRDSLDYRMLTAAAAVLNFTYEMRVPLDDQWGVSLDDGNWTGTVGTLQHQRADFSMLLSWMSSRLQVVDYTRPYITEPLVIVTDKAGPLPQIFALVRPFPGMLWAWVLVTTMGVGVAKWALHMGWRWASGGEGREMSFSSALLSAWGMILEDPLPRLPTNLTSQMLVGWWWVFCMLLTTAYRSSLVAHLSVPDKSPTIDNLEQLLGQRGWTWGMEGTYGIGWEWFRKSTVPTIRKVYEKIQALSAEEHLSRVLRGHHAFLTWKYYIRTLIASRYTDVRGFTPLYIGRTEYINYGGYGWGFRKGAPFLRRFGVMQQRMVEAGLVKHWMNDLIIKASREARTANKMESTTDMQEGRGLVVLGLRQLQGAFYLLGLGSLAAFMVLVAERLVMELSPRMKLWN